MDVLYLVGSFIFGRAGRPKLYYFTRSPCRPYSGESEKALLPDLELGVLPFSGICVYGIELTTKEFKMTTNQKRALRRSKRNRIVAGVCGGLAEFFGISSFWFRLALIIAFIPGGVPGLLIYLILWMIIPGE